MQWLSGRSNWLPANSSSEVLGMFVLGCINPDGTKGFCEPDWNEEEGKEVKELRVSLSR
jgi:hypothetical protein